MVDILSFLLPGGAVILACAYAARDHLPWNPGDPKVNAILRALESGWLAFLLLLVFLGGAYVAGVLLKTIDSCFGPKWDEVLDASVKDMAQVKDALQSAVHRKLGLKERMTDRKMHNMAHVLVRSRPSGALLPWAEWYDGLQNLHGGLAWALWVGTATIVGASAAPFTRPDLWLLLPAALVLLAIALACWPNDPNIKKLTKRLTGILDRIRGLVRLERRTNGPEDEKQIDIVVGSVVLIAAIVLGLSQKWLHLTLLLGAALGYELKRRQRALRKMQYNAIWHGALLALRSIKPRPVAQPGGEGH